MEVIILIVISSYNINAELWSVCADEAQDNRGIVGNIT